MKKTLLMLTVAGMAMAGCSNSEVLDQATEVQTGKINFESLVGKNTRVPMNNSSLNSFYVFGKYEKNGKSTQIFNDICVKKGEDGTWAYEGQARYWIAGANYKFSAYTNGNNQISNNGRANYDAEAGELAINGYRVDNTNQEDLIYATSDRTNAKDLGNDKVALAFKHLLAKLHVTFESTFPEGYTIEITNVLINNVRDAGNYNAEKNENGNSGRGVWSHVERTAKNVEIKFNFKNGETTSNKATITAATTDKEAVTATTEDKYVMPFVYQDKNVDLKFDIIVYDPQNEEVFRETLKGQWQPTWEMGTSYNYRVTLNGSAAGMQKIEFTVDPDAAVDDWVSADGQELSFDRNTSTDGN